jgi:hypothetical protein
MAAKREQWRIIAYLDGLTPIGDLRYPFGHRQAKINALPAPPVPTFSVGGSFGAGVIAHERGGVAPAFWADVDIVPERSKWDAIR